MSQNYSYDDFQLSAIKTLNGGNSTDGWVNNYDGSDDASTSTPISAENLNAMLQMLVDTRNVIGKTTDFEDVINDISINPPDPESTKDSQSLATYLKEAFSAIVGEEGASDKVTLAGLSSEVATLEASRPNLTKGDGAGSTVQESFDLSEDENGDPVTVPGAKASGKGSVAFGGKRFDSTDSKDIQTEVKGNQSFAAGIGILVNGDWSTAFGKENITNQNVSFAAGGNNTVGLAKDEYDVNNETPYEDSFSFAFAAGLSNESKGYASFVGGGQYNKALGNFSHAEGYGTKTVASAQHAQGKFNKESGDYIHIVGNGTSDTARSNAHTIDWGGNAQFARNVYAQYNWDTNIGKKLATEDYVDTKSTWNNIESRPALSNQQGSGSIIQESFEAVASNGEPLLDDKENPCVDNNKPLTTGNPIVTGAGSIAFGGRRYDQLYDTEENNPTTTITGHQSFSAGAANKIAAKFGATFGVENIIEEKGVASFIAGGWDNVAAGQGAHVEGSTNKATAFCSHVEGYKNVAGVEGDTNAGKGAHVEGIENVAAGYGSHAEGEKTNTSGRAAHVEGASNTSEHDYTHIEGYNNNSTATYQHIEGKWSVSDPEYIHITGNGTSVNWRNNAFALSKEGTGYFGGPLYINCDWRTGYESNGERVATGRYVDSEVEKLNETISKLEGKLTTHITDSEVSYSKVVPEAVRNKAILNKVGGSGSAANPTKVTAIKFLGENHASLPNSNGEVNRTSWSKVSYGLSIKMTSDDSGIEIEPGTASGDSYTQILYQNAVTFTPGTYYISGCPLGASESSYCYFVSLKEGLSPTQTFKITTDDYILECNEEFTMLFGIYVKQNFTIEHSVIFKPEIRKLEDTYEIPFAILSLNGYGTGNGDYYSYIDFDKKKFIRADLDASTATYTEQDISNYLKDYPEFKIINVKPDNRIIAENQNKNPVPWTITYAKTFE